MVMPLAEPLSIVYAVTSDTYLVAIVKSPVVPVTCWLVMLPSVMVLAPGPVVVVTPFRAVVLDFGSAALLPHAGGPPFDPRFYYWYSDAEPVELEAPPRRDLKETKLRQCGMSHREPSSHYDLCLFLYGVHAGGGGRLPPDFQALYARRVGAVLASAALAFQDADKRGRLTAAGQRALMRRGRGGAAAAILADDPYFGPLRSGGDGCRPPAVRAGITPTSVRKRRRTPSRGCEDGDRCVLAAGEEAEGWTPKLSPAPGRLVNAPPPGAWRCVKRRLSQLLRGAAPPRPSSSPPTSATTKTALHLG